MGGVGEGTGRSGAGGTVATCCMLHARVACTRSHTPIEHHVLCFGVILKKSLDHLERTGRAPVVAGHGGSLQCRRKGGRKALRIALLGALELIGDDGRITPDNGLQGERVER